MTLIYPYFNYYNIIWGAADPTAIEPLTILQKKAIRIISRARYLDHTEPLFISMGLLTLSELFNLNCILFIYKCSYTNQFTDFSYIMIRCSDIHAHNTVLKQKLECKFLGIIVDDEIRWKPHMRTSQRHNESPI